MTTNQVPLWISTLVGDIAHVVSGGTPTASDPTNFAEPSTGIAWLTPADLSGFSGKYISHGKRDLSKAGLKSSSATLMPKGSILFSSRAPIGYVAIASNEISTNQGFKSFVFTNDIEPDFAFYYFKSIKSLAESFGTGTTFKELSGTAAKKLPFLLFPLAEQKVIAEKLDFLLAQVESTKARLESIPGILKQFRQSVLAAAVSGELTEDWRERKSFQEINITHDDKLPKIADRDKFLISPRTWKWVRLGSVATLINGDRGKNYPNKSEYVEKGMPFINTGHIEPNGTLSLSRMNYITQDKYNSLGGGKIKKGDLVYCLRGATMGKAAKVDYEVGAVASSLVIIRASEGLVNTYAYFFLISPSGRELIEQYE